MAVFSRTAGENPQNILLKQLSKPGFELGVSGFIYTEPVQRLQRMNAGIKAVTYNSATQTCHLCCISS